MTLLLLRCKFDVVSVEVCVGRMLTVCAGQGVSWEVWVVKVALDGALATNSIPAVCYLTYFSRLERIMT